MVENVNSRIQQYNYNTICSVKNTVNTQNVNQTVTQPSFTASSSAKTPQTNNNISIRTTLSSKEEKAKYAAILSHLDKTGRKVIWGVP